MLLSFPQSSKMFVQSGFDVVASMPCVETRRTRPLSLFGRAHNRFLRIHPSKLTEMKIARE